ncbi:MAG: LysM peptidoglycan-binding domain-containing protein, partial [Deinococcus sp.]|uniref:LysM peptidoglycan-binding domain-containing M23 family metallopeptidase n=1 Tax=Deinococcus sp. TaxID=47478 RepID=UPI0026DD85F4
MKARFLLLAALLSVSASAYTVKKGDTFYSLARASGVSVDELLRLNGLSSPELRVGQVIRLPGEAAPNAPKPTAPPAPTVKLPTVATSAHVLKLPGVTITAPKGLRMGDGFVLRLSGERAGETTVRFPSEVGEDVRQPNEELRPVGAAGEYVVPGRVVLGKETPVVYEVRLGDSVVKGQIPVRSLGQPTQHLNLPPSVSKVLVDPARAAEDAAVEQAYNRRTPQAWTKPFAAPLANVGRVSSGFGQPRTYVKGGKVAYHYGTDYPAPVGTPILAVNDGTVVMAGKYPVRGG